jgi:uncharacterized protein CbrC (UPF0167 family)
MANLCGDHIIMWSTLCTSYIKFSNDEVETLRSELSEVYKKKAINDQQLIDTSTKVQELEKKLTFVIKELILLTFNV